MALGRPQVELLEASFMASPTPIHSLMPTRKARCHLLQARCHLAAARLSREVPQDRHVSQCYSKSKIKFEQGA